jgi:hypothetical protein
MVTGYAKKRGSRFADGYKKIAGCALRVPLFVLTSFGAKTSFRLQPAFI